MNVNVDDMRILIDFPTFKHIDNTWPYFKTLPRNLKLGVGLDNVSPFSMQSQKMVNMASDRNQVQYTTIHMNKERTLEVILIKSKKEIS